MRNIGIYSGTFDPIHPGHIALADEARRLHNLDIVVFMPEPSPRYKPTVTPIAVRAEQLMNALASTPHEVYVSTSSQFKVTDTLAELRELYPDDQLSFIIGSDIVATLSSWPESDQLLSNHQLIVGMRSRDDREVIEQILRGLNADYAIVNTSYAHYASSQFRQSEPTSTSGK